MIAALRDCQFYLCPSHSDARPGKMHVIIARESTNDVGPACGYPFHNETTKQIAASVSAENRCMRAGCRSRWPKEPDHA